MIELLGLPVIKFEDYSTDFTWDNILHFPVATINYIRNRLGVDMTILCGTEVQAKQIILSSARTLKYQLNKYQTFNNQQVLEFAMSRMIEMIYQVLEIQCEIMSAGINTGSVLNLYKINKADVIIPAIEDAINTTGFKFKGIRGIHDIPESIYHKGY